MTHYLRFFSALEVVQAANGRDRLATIPQSGTTRAATYRMRGRVRSRSDGENGPGRPATANGWERTRRRVNGSRTWLYVPKSSEDEPDTGDTVDGVGTENPASMRPRRLSLRRAAARSARRSRAGPSWAGRCCSEASATIIASSACGHSRAVWLGSRDVVLTQMRIGPGSWLYAATRNSVISMMISMMSARSTPYVATRTP